MGFRTRVCDAQTHHFVRLDFEYREPDNSISSSWGEFDGNYTALLDDGKIREIVIDANGSRYISPILNSKERVEKWMQSLCFVTKVI